MVDLYVVHVDTDLFYKYDLKGKLSFFSDNLPKTNAQEFRGLPNSQTLCFAAWCSKQHCAAKRLAPAGWRNKLPWMEKSFLEESLTCLRPETRHFPSEVQETILDCSHKSKSSPMLPHNSLLIAKEAVWFGWSSDFRFLSSLLQH